MNRAAMPVAWVKVCPGTLLPPTIGPGELASVKGQGGFRTGNELIPNFIPILQIINSPSCAVCILQIFVEGYPVPSSSLSPLHMFAVALEYVLLLPTVIIIITIIIADSSPRTPFAPPPPS